MFIEFLNQLKRKDNISILEAISSGYKALYEAESINKQYLLKLSGNDENKLQKAKNTVNSFWSNEGMSEVIKKSEKILPLLYMFELKEEGSVNKDSLHVIHDLAVANKLNTLDKLNSDSSPNDFRSFLTTAERGLKNLGDLNQDEEKTWLRVKEFHDFGDGFKWIVAIDEKGNVSGYMPSCITQKTAGHCGNQPSVRDGDQYYELRKDNKPYLTVILDREDKIAESKGYGNKKVKADEILPYLKWLLSHEKVKGVSQRYDYGYAPDVNMGLKDFFGNDDEFIDKMEKEKPALVGSTEKKILNYKRQLKSGEITEEQIIELFKESDIDSVRARDNIVLHELRGILGRIPFTEDEIINMIKNLRLQTIEIANTDTKLLTKNIQNALIETNLDNIDPLIDIYNQVPNSNIQLDLIFNKKPELFKDIDPNKKREVYQKYKKILDKNDDIMKMLIGAKDVDIYKDFIKGQDEKVIVKRVKQLLGSNTLGTNDQIRNGTDVLVNTYDSLSDLYADTTGNDSDYGAFENYDFDSYSITEYNKDYLENIDDINIDYLYRISGTDNLEDLDNFINSDIERGDEIKDAIIKASDSANRSAAEDEHYKRLSEDLGETNDYGFYAIIDAYDDIKLFFDSRFLSQPQVIEMIEHDEDIDIREYLEWGYTNEEMYPKFDDEVFNQQLKEEIYNMLVDPNQQKMDL